MRKNGMSYRIEKTCTREVEENLNMQIRENKNKINGKK